MKKTAILAMAMLARASQADVTNLCSIPIADILAHREAMLMYTLSGNEKNISGGAYSHALNGVIGLFDRVELGVTTDFLGNTTYGAKVLLFENDRGALSAGAWGYDRRKADPFLVGRLDFDRVRFHGGVIRDDRHRIMLGFDAEVSRELSVMADWISGPNNYLNVGACWNVPKVPGLCVMPVVGFPSVRGDGITHSLNIFYGIKF